MEEKLEKFDKVIYGLGLGFILPIIGYYLSYLVKGRNVDWNTYVEYTIQTSEYQQDILIFCLIPNMLLFYFTNFRWRLYEFTKGLVGITVVALLILIFMTY